MLPTPPELEIKPKFIEFTDYTNDFICIPVAPIVSFNTINNGCNQDYNPGISIVFGSTEKNYYFKNRAYRDKVFNVIRSNFSIEVVVEDLIEEYDLEDNVPSCYDRDEDPSELEFY